jgi:hypothetical protein
MKRQISTLTILFIALALFTSGCYTQLQTVPDREYLAPVSTSGFYSWDGDENARPAAQQAPQTARTFESEEEADLYVEGYEDGVVDGWADAEEFFFKDYETENWYRDKNLTLGSTSSPSNVTYIENYYGGCDNVVASCGAYEHYWWNRYRHYPAYHHLYFSYGYYNLSNYHFASWYVSPHYAWHKPHWYWHSHRSYYSFGWSHFPGYYSYYNPWYGYNTFVYVNYNYFNTVNNRVIANRTQAARNSGLASSGTTRDSRIRGTSNTQLRNSSTSVRDRQRTIRETLLLLTAPELLILLTEVTPEVDQQ